VNLVVEFCLPGYDVDLLGLGMGPAPKAGQPVLAEK